MVKLTSILCWNGFHNIPKKYIMRRMFKGVVYENNYYLTPPVIYNYTRNWQYTEDAPWTSAALDKNNPAKKEPKPPCFPPLKDWFWFRGDLVEILTGKDSGKVGEVVGVIRQRNWVIVGGLNTKLEYMGSAGICKQVEKPLIVNKEVKLIDPLDKKPCDAVWRYTEEGERVRISKRSGRLIPIPEAAESTIDYPSKSSYAPADKDTTADNLKKRTFKAKPTTFEDDLMKEYNIEEKRVRAPTYFY